MKIAKRLLPTNLFTKLILWWRTTFEHLRSWGICCFVRPTWNAFDLAKWR